MVPETREHVIVAFANSNTCNKNTFTSSTSFRWEWRQSLAVWASQKRNGLESLNSDVSSDELKIQKDLKSKQNKAENF